MDRIEDRAVLSEPRDPETCAHIVITTFGDGENGPSLWACADCRLRFYPACRTCVDVGHRNIEHPDPIPATEERSEERAMSDPLTAEDWSRLLDYLEVNAPCDVDDVIAVLEVRAHRAEKRAATPAWSDAEGLLGGLDEDDVMYDYPVAMSGEPMDPVLFVRWDAVRSALARLAATQDPETEG
jgi:hypothetical protein